MHRSSKLEALQALRAFAALAVMLFHGTELLRDRAGYLLLDDFFRPGRFGVDVFFVLSGFIIYLTAVRGGGRRDFLLKRFVRLFPIYWIVTGLLLVVYFAAPRPEMAHKGDPVVILRSILLLPAPRHVVGVAWTLVYEVWFYLLFGLLFFRSPRLLFAALGTWASLGWASRHLLSPAPEGSALDFLLNPIVAEFLFGCGAAWLFTRGAPLRGSVALALGVAGFGAAWTAFLAGSLSLPRELAFGLPSALVVFGAARSRVPLPRPLTYLGDASYSIYLLHGTAISATLMLASRLGPAAGLASFWGALLVLAAALGLCCAFYAVVERPVLTWCRRRWLAGSPVRGGETPAPAPRRRSRGPRFAPPASGV